MLSNFLDHLYQNKITKYHILYAIEGLFIIFVICNQLELLSI